MSVGAQKDLGGTKLLPKKWPWILPEKRSVFLSKLRWPPEKKRSSLKLRRFDKCQIAQILTQTCPKSMKLPKILMQYCPNNIKGSGYFASRGKIAPCYFAIWRQNSQINQIFHYTRCNTLRRVTSWRGPFPRHCTRATQLLSKKCRSGGEPLATLCPIWPARDLNFRPPAPETNALPQRLFCRKSKIALSLMLTQTLTPTQTLTLILTLIPTLALTLTQTNPNRGKTLFCL